MTSIAKIAKKNKILECKKCNYYTCNQYDYNKHCQTQKHKLKISAMTINDLSIVSENKLPQKKIFLS